MKTKNKKKHKTTQTINICSLLFFCCSYFCLFFSTTILLSFIFFFFFNDTATTEIYTLSLHDALPIYFDWPYATILSRGDVRSWGPRSRSEEHTSELQSHSDLVCRLLLEKKKNDHIKFNLTIQLQQLNGLETLVIIMVVNKYAFLQITIRRFLNEWEAFKKFFFFNDTATPEIYTLSLHDALPICTARRPGRSAPIAGLNWPGPIAMPAARTPDRKSTRLNSSHTVISYAVFCLKKKKNSHIETTVYKKKTKKNKIY